MNAGTTSGSALPSVDTIFATLPLATYQAGETVLHAGSKTGRLFILKSGGVTIFKDAIEIGRVEEPGAVLGELSALLDRPHNAEVRALRETQFHVADAALLQRDPATILHVARILALRLVAADNGLIELKKQINSKTAPSRLSKMVADMERILSVGGSDLKQWL